MYINLCPDTIGISGSSFKEIVNLALNYGFEGVDFSPNYFTSIEEAKEAGELLRSKNLKWGLFYLPCDFLRAEDDEYARGLERLEQILPIVQAAGCKHTYNHIWPGSNSMDFNENYKWHISRLKTLVYILFKYDVRMGVEFIGAKTLRDSFKYPFIYSLNQALELADTVSPELGIIIDFYHWYTSGSTLEDIKAIGSGDRIVNVHANDAVIGRSREMQLDLEREMPMATGLVDAGGILKTLKELSYEGPVICEPFQPSINRMKAMDADSVAKEVSTYMKKLFEKIMIKQ